MNRMNILFSPIGNTDPIANDLDGAMLHICRHYPIDRVVMYMSKEILSHHRADNRYVDSLEKLAAHLGREITHEIIERPELDNVQVFDGFISDFGAILADIHAKYPDAEVYLNVSSGTPAMKSALQILAAYREFDYKPIQVAGPGYRENRKPFDIKTAFDDDLDNLPESTNRCSISTNLDLSAETKKKMISALIDNYDYSGALLLAKDTARLGGEFLTLLKGADYRYKFELEKARELFAEAGLSDMLYEDVPENLLILWVKNERDEIADFLRAITPLMDVLYHSALKNCCGFDIDSFVIDTPGGQKWDTEALDRAAASDTIAATVKTRFAYDDSRIINSSILNKLIKELSADSALKKVFNDLRDVEQNARNIIAHQFRSISRKDLHDMNIGSVRNILKNLYTAAVMSGRIAAAPGTSEDKARKEFFDSYILMNKKLKALL